MNQEIEIKHLEVSDLPFWDITPCSPLKVFDTEDGGDLFLRNFG
jgi:hypothetical protein